MEDTQKLLKKERKKKGGKEVRGKEWKSELTVKNMSYLEGRRDRKKSIGN